jgi:hypothetical protein
VIRITADDMGHNSTGVPFQTTATFTIIVNPGLANGRFVSGTNFQFDIIGLDGSGWVVWASPNLTNWTNLDVVSVSGGTTAFVDTNAAIYGQRFYQATQGTMASDVIGFINVTVPGMVGTNGSSAFIANQLNNPSGNTLGVLMPTMPNGTDIYKWDTSAQNWISTFFSGRANAWGNPSLTMNPGEGALIQNPTTNALVLTFIGTVPLGPQSLTVSTNETVLSSVVPISADMGTLGFPLSNGDVFYHWDLATQGYDVYQLARGTWSPSPFTPQVGESFFFSGSSSVTTNRTWTENFSISP